MDPVSARDGASAIWARDLEALQNALAKGWSLPSVRSRTSAGSTEDISLVLRVISSGWLEGWRVWLEKRPDFASHPIIIESAITHAQPAILEAILEKNDGILPWEREDELLPHHLLFQLIGNPLGPMAENQAIASTAEVLSQAGFSAAHVYPGEYSPQDLSPPGHTLLTWALLWGVWELAEMMNMNDDIFQMPKASQSLDRWFEKSWVPTWAAPADVLKESPARAFWLNWMNKERFTQWFLKSSLLKSVEMHEVIQSLPAPYQEVVWMEWLQPSGEDWSLLHDLVASTLEKPQVERILSAIEKSVPSSAWKEAWNREDEYGVSPSKVWATKNLSLTSQDVG